MTAVADLKKTRRATWAAGAHAAVADVIDEVPPRDLLRRMEIRPGDDTLDVATGTGNVALQGAPAGASASSNGKRSTGRCGASITGWPPVST